MSNKRVLVFGGSGMLGLRVVAALHAAGHMVVNTPSHKFTPIDCYGDVDKALGWVPVPEIVINCAGAISARGLQPIYDMVAANAVGPYVIAAAAKARHLPVIHISTDCVFNGQPDQKIPGRRYEVRDVPDAQDIYGRSKALGEVQAPHVTNVRTSFIGPEHGLWAWLVAEAAKSEGHSVRSVDGWANAFWTGSTADAVASEIAKMAEHPPGGTVHLATAEKLSKLEVLQMLKAHLGLNVNIGIMREMRIDRALEPTIVLPSLQEALLGLGKEQVRP